MDTWTPVYSWWRHGGWYVDNVHYPSGAVGCVSRNYPDRKWRIACDDRHPQPTYRSRDEAARAERELARAEGGR
jgi:hypothetical protein